MKHDQYGNEIPEELVVLDNDISRYTDDEIQQIVQARWYETEKRHCILIPQSEAPDWIETRPIDAEVDMKVDALYFIDDVLKRWSEEDGFYHA